MSQNIELQAFYAACAIQALGYHASIQQAQTFPQGMDDASDII